LIAGEAAITPLSLRRKAQKTGLAAPLGSEYAISPVAVAEEQSLFLPVSNDTFHVRSKNGSQS
jgi:hypothetical protein